MKRITLALTLVAALTAPACLGPGPTAPQPDPEPTPPVVECEGCTVIDRA